ncbi:hypothetical protein V8E54_010903 [Elaphomyces granulatus]
MQIYGRLSAPYLWVWVLHEHAKNEGHLPRDSFLYDWIFREYDQIAISLKQSNSFTGFQSWENFEKEVELGDIHAGARFSDERILEQKFTNHHLLVKIATKQESTKSSSISVPISQPDG